MYRHEKLPYHSHCCILQYYRLYPIIHLLPGINEMSLVATKQLDKRTYRYNRNGSHGGQSQCRLKHRHPQAKPEYVHKEHAVAESRHFGNEARRLRNADATEQQKRACRQRHAIKGAESPSHLNDRRRMNHSRNSLDIERPYGSHRPDQHKQETDPQTQGTPPT